MLIPEIGIITALVILLFLIGTTEPRVHRGYRPKDIGPPPKTPHNMLSAPTPGKPPTVSPEDYIQLPTRPRSTAICPGCGTATEQRKCEYCGWIA